MSRLYKVIRTIWTKQIQLICCITVLISVQVVQHDLRCKTITQECVSLFSCEKKNRTVSPVYMRQRVIFQSSMLALNNQWIISRSFQFGLDGWMLVERKFGWEDLNKAPFDSHIRNILRQKPDLACQLMDTFWRLSKTFLGLLQNHCTQTWRSGSRRLCE